METIALKRLQTLLSDYKEKTLRLCRPVWKAMTYNLADGVLAPSKIVCVSIQKGGLAVVYGSRFLSKIKIRASRHYTTEEGKYLQPDSLAKTVKLAVDELRAKKINVSLSIPREWVVVRTAELPLAVRENLLNVVSYELDRLTPLASESAFYDFQVLGEKEGKLTLMVWAVRTNAVSPYIDALRKEGIGLKTITVDLSGLCTLSRYVADDADHIFLGHDRNGYQGGLVVGGNLMAVMGDFFDGQNAAIRKERLMSGIFGLVDKLRGYGSTPQILLYPDGIEPMVSQNEAGVPVRIVNTKEVGKKLGTESTDFDNSAAGGMIEALWDKARPLNLLGKGLRVSEKTPVTITVLLLLFIAALAGIAMIMPLQRQEKVIQEIDRQINSRKEEVKRVEALKKEIEALTKDIATIRGFKDKRPTTLTLLKELTNVLPKTVWLTRVRITETNADIEGYANSATEIISKLEASPLFRKVEFASPTIRDTRLNADRFVIKMELEGLKKAEDDNGKDAKKK